jgi:hypothetical protein
MQCVFAMMVISIFSLCLLSRGLIIPTIVISSFFPFKVKKLEDSFLLTITGLVEEVLLGTKDTEEMKNVYENLFAAMNSYFATPYLDFTSEDFLRRTLP